MGKLQKLTYVDSALVFGLAIFVATTISSTPNLLFAKAISDTGVTTVGCTDRGNPPKVDGMALVTSDQAEAQEWCTKGCAPCLGKISLEDPSTGPTSYVCRCS